MKKLLKLTNIAFDHLVNIWGFLGEMFNLTPLVFRIRITNKCNLSCHYCYVGTSLNKKIENLLTLEEWKTIIQKLPSITLVDITGGEPFLTPHFEEILNHLLDRKLKVSLITNGTIFRESIFKLIVDKKLTHFMISFDGHKDSHDKVRGVGSFDKAIRAAQSITQYKKIVRAKVPLVVAKVTFSEENYSDVEKLIEYLLREVGFDGVTINLLFSNNSRNGFVDGQSIAEEKFWSGNTMCFSQDKITSMTESMKNLFNRFPGKIQMRPEINLNQLTEYFKNPNLFSPNNCFKYRSVITMYGDGTLAPCDLGLNVGNIRDIDFDLSKSGKINRLKSFFELFIKENRAIPGCQGCCLKKHELRK